MGEEGLLIDQKKCIKCLACLETCLMDALELRGQIYSKTILNLAEKL
jgi:NAD-dependent dihydropyrimidine dehydrogenase PreA subunit